MLRNALPALIGGLLILGVGLWVALQFDLRELDPELIRSWGLPAQVGYALTIMLLGGVGVPPVALMVPTVEVWPFWTSLIISLCGGLGASVTGLLLSRYFLREKVTPRIPARIARYEHRLETHGFSTVLVLRLLFYLFPPINWMLGISAISLPVFVTATLLGMIPGTLVYLLTSKGVFAFLGLLSLWQILLLMGVVGCLLVLWWRWATQ